MTYLIACYYFYYESLHLHYMWKAPTCVYSLNLPLIYCVWLHLLRVFADKISKPEERTMTTFSPWHASTYVFCNYR